MSCYIYRSCPSYCGHSWQGELGYEYVKPKYISELERGESKLSTEQAEVYSYVNQYGEYATFADNALPTVVLKVQYNTHHKYLT